VQDRWGRTVYRHDQRTCLNCDETDLRPGAAPAISAQRARVMDAITAYQLTSMMEGVVQRGTAARTVNLSVPVAGKTGTTNEARDVWFVGYTSNIVAGCYIGYDRPRPLGRGASGGGMCGPVFTRFMQDAVAEFGGTRFAVPPGGRFIRIDRRTGERLPDDASGADVVAEYFREGAEPVFGIGALIDGGFAMGVNLPMFSRDQDADDEWSGGAAGGTGGTGGTGGAGGAATFGTVSSGGLY
jgi:penicillin-binding protein 1A